MYIAKPYENPFDSLLALYIVVKDPQLGVIVKLAGKIEPNPVTGQLVTTVDEDPQVPFSRFTLKLRQGAASPLVSPPACGTYTAAGELTPWSAPLIPVPVNSSFQIEDGVGGGRCPAGGIPPFHPGIVAGTLNNSAGAYSPMDIHITRNDGEQEITRFTSILPAGLTANLSGVPFCPDSDIEAAKHVSGAQEEAEPSCPAASEIGHTLVGAGVGSTLAYAPGKVYMAGPYNGAPFSVVSITSAKVGPFDLGTVVVRFALVINPETAVVTVDAKASDPIPHIIDGIIIHVRDIRVYINRPEFMINPTNCDPRASPRPSTVAARNRRTPPTRCRSRSRARSRWPTARTSSSNRASRSQPREALAARWGEPARPAHLPQRPTGHPDKHQTRQSRAPQTTALQASDTAEGLPGKDVRGEPRAMPGGVGDRARDRDHADPARPLTGPAYFVSYGGAKFPELIIVLQGYGVTLDLHGETFISKQGVTSSTFKTVPDDPIGSFELTLPQGRYSALAAIGNPCKGTLTMPTEFLAQNGDAIHQQTKIAVTGCPKAKKTTHKKHKAKAKKKARRGHTIGKPGGSRGVSIGQSRPACLQSYSQSRNPKLVFVILFVRDGVERQPDRGAEPMVDRRGLAGVGPPPGAARQAADAPAGGLRRRA